MHWIPGDLAILLVAADILFGELLTQTTLVGTTQVHKLTLTYDGMGRIKTKKDTIPSVTTPAYDYTYNNLGRLATVKNGTTTIATYVYDLNGNRIQKIAGTTTTNYTYDNQDRMLTAGSFTFTYNANGEMTSRKNTVLNQTTQYTWDSFGNLTQVKMPNGDVYSYELDAKNRRIGKKKNGVRQVRYVYMDDLRIAAELNPNLTIKRRFVYGSKGNIPDYYIEGANKFRIVSDQLGSPRVIFNMGTGAVVAKYDHDEFGVIKVNTNMAL
jgi:YD repeat-containing protein